jgi:hypothetical protein
VTQGVAPRYWTTTVMLTSATFFDSGQQPTFSADGHSDVLPPIVIRD